MSRGQRVPRAGCALSSGVPGLWHSRLCQLRGLSSRARFHTRLSPSWLFSQGQGCCHQPPPSSGRSETWHTPPKGEDREWGTGGVAVCKEPVPGHHRIGGGGDEATKRGNGGAARIEPFLSSASTASRTSLVPPQGQCEPPPLPPCPSAHIPLLDPPTPPFPHLTAVRPAAGPPRRAAAPHRSANRGAAAPPAGGGRLLGAPAAGTRRVPQHDATATLIPLPPWDRSINTCALVRGRAHKHAMGTAAGCWEHG